MNPERWLEEYTARIEAIRWLRPDAEIDALTEGAQQWISDRVEEHVVALSRFSPEGESLSLSWSPVRMIDQARELSAHAPSATQSAGFSHAALTWLARLDDARSFGLARARDALGAAQRIAVAEAVWSVLRGPAKHARKRAFQAHDPRARLDVGGRVRDAEDFLIGAPGGTALALHALWALSDPDGPSSPWEPLIALWERGVCPLAAPDGTALMYVPLRRDGALQTTEGVDSVHLMFRGGLSPEGGMRTRVTALHKITRAALKGFNQHGLGALPEMCAPLNVSPVASVTNWPGPPDPYVCPPPARVDDEALDRAAAQHIANVATSVAVGASLPPSFAPRAAPWLRRSS